MHVSFLAHPIAVILVGAFIVFFFLIRFILSRFVSFRFVGTLVIPAVFYRLCQSPHRDKANASQLNLVNDVLTG